VHHQGRGHLTIGTLEKKQARAVTHDLIKKCAVELFEKQGVEETSVNQIVHRAGVAKGTFYLYFESKDELIDAVFERYSEQFFSRVVEPNGTEPRVKAFSASIIDYFAGNRLFLVELRRSLFENRGYRYTEKTVQALTLVIMNYLNLNRQYPITRLDTYSRMIIGMILEICYRLIVDGTITDRGEAQVMLEDFLKRFFDCGEFFT
jgi:AcrR family transcriptional regulator